MNTGRVRVYIACSLDGFIAAPDDDVSWLHEAGPANAPPADRDVLRYDAFTADVGALLMGRRTYEVVRGFDIGWPYGTTPVLVATRRPLESGLPPSVRPVEGSIDELVRLALEAAEGRDVYLDGGDLIRQAADADLIDDLTITMAPIALGAGRPLFAGLAARYPLEILSHRTYDSGMVQLHARPRSR